MGINRRSEREIESEGGGNIRGKIFKDGISLTRVKALAMETSCLFGDFFFSFNSL